MSNTVMFVGMPALPRRKRPIATPASPDQLERHQPNDADDQLPRHCNTALTGQSSVDGSRPKPLCRCVDSTSAWVSRRD